MSKYANVRIEAVQACGACNGRGTTTAATAINDPRGPQVDHVPCWACDGRGETRTPLLLPGEPFFLVRGKDELAEQIVAVYGVLFARAHGLRAGEWPWDLEAKLAAIVEWQDANPGLVKRPD